MRLAKWPGWTDWKLLQDLEWNNVPAGPITYMIATDRPLNRAVGCDEEGILDIGKSKTGRARLKIFQ